MIFLARDPETLGKLRFLPSRPSLHLQKNVFHVPSARRYRPEVLQVIYLYFQRDLSKNDGFSPKTRVFNVLFTYFSCIFYSFSPSEICKSIFSSTFVQNVIPFSSGYYRSSPRAFFQSEATSCQPIIGFFPVLIRRPIYDRS